MHSPVSRLYLFLFDVLACVCAFIISGILASVIGNTLFSSVGTEAFWYADSADRLYAFMVAASAALLAFYNRGHYLRRIPWWSQVRYVILVCLIMFFVDGFFHFAIKFQFSRLWIGLSWVCTAAFILIGRNLAMLCAKTTGQWRIKTLIVGSKANAIDTLQAIQSDHFTGYKVNALILEDAFSDNDRLFLPNNSKQIEILSRTEDLLAAIQDRPHEFVILAPDTFQSLNIDAIIAYLQNAHIPYAVVPPIEGFTFYGSAPQYFFGHDVMLIQPRPRISAPLWRFCKRSMDIIVSGSALLALSPLLLSIAVAIKLQGSAILFPNLRIGRKGKTFNCWKFTSMRADAESYLEKVLENDPEAKAQWETHRKLTDDPRVTKIGRFLRKNSLDELPQLWNIFVGDMSLVGPRPILPDETSFYNEEELESYYSVRPGLSGLWQVSGRNNVSFRYRIHMDNWYIKNWSLWHDIVILFKTVTTLINRAGAR